MRGLLARIVSAGVGLWLADLVLKGIELRDFEALALGALVLAAAHATLRPLLAFLTFPITLLTLGAWLLAINAALLFGTGWLVPGVSVRGVVPAVLGAVLVSLFAGIAQWMLEGPETPDDRG